MTWWLVSAWLVALALCARWVWRTIKVDEIMSPAWLKELHEKNKEEDRCRSALEATAKEDVAEAKRIQKELGIPIHGEEEINWDKEAREFEEAAEFDRRRQWANQHRSEGD